MGDIKRIGIITSGGDCGGLNAVIKGAAGVCDHFGLELLAIPSGYAGLYNLVDFAEGELVSFNNFRLSMFSVALAGSELGNSRVKIAKIKDEKKYERIRRGLEKHRIDALVISGGDDSGSVAQDLNRQDIPVNHAPKTMDMDLQPYSVGADSVDNSIARMAHNLKTTGQTHNRIIILDVFGRYVGHSAFRGGIAADADCILIPEITPDFDVVYEHMFPRYTERVLKTDVLAGWYLIVTAEAMKGDPSKEDVNEEGFIIDKKAEPDSFGHYPLVGAGKKVEKELKKRLKADERIKEFMVKSHKYVPGQYEIPEVRVIKPTHALRCGPCSAYDANFGKEAGAGAVLLLLKGITGKTVTGFQNGELQYMPISLAIKRRAVDLEQVSLHEAMGTCFGRIVPTGYSPMEVKEVETVRRHM